MEVLSNKEIYVLLKILNDKKVKEGSSSTIEVDKNFSLKELEHIQQEVALAENKTTNEVLTIENTYKTRFGQSFHSGYKLNIINIETITNYAVEYVQALAQENLFGLTDENKLSLLMEEFYSSAKNISDYDNYVVNEIKYMPIVLLTYTNNLVDLKTLTNRKYDFRRDMGDEIFSDKLDIRDDEIMIRMNVSKFVDLCQNLGTEGREIIQAIMGNATIINTETIKKPKRKAPNPQKDRYHMQPKQWEIFLCLLKVANEARKIGQEVAEISKEHLIKNRVVADSTGAMDTAKTRFNEKYNEIKDNKEGEYEDLIYPKVSDTRYYEFNVSKVINLHNIIIKNKYLSVEYIKHRGFLNQIVDYDLPK